MTNVLINKDKQLNDVKERETYIFISCNPTDRYNIEINLYWVSFTLFVYSVCFSTCQYLTLHIPNLKTKQNKKRNFDSQTI